MKHAFLIIAHSDFGVLQRLISVLENPEIDIYIHIDAKVKNIPSLQVSGISNLFILSDRKDTRWGDFSQITTELALMEYAFSKGSYSHYHLISGTHFPLKPINEILTYYNNYYGKIVLHNFCTPSSFQEKLKLKSYNFCTRQLHYGPSWRQVFYQRIWNLLHIIQKVFKISRNKDVVFYKASNWVTLSEEATEYLINRKPLIYRIFKWTFCGDEFFVPTLLKDSPYSDYIINSDKILEQRMGDANTKIYTENDFDALMSSECLFARKFSDNYINVVERIQSTLQK